ncbi:hypothetical protein KIW84_040580 [Lathyrus oleraceus]|uniref:Retrovirus-related Pol polyprotein from transposon TNT 1-94 n=1 Tax=Pisum sativum TaxID=3888 RepID=A0A9D4XAE5_PEA|nr:hypothetical protein KIW84_040580 [Pisum sativum]
MHSHASNVNGKNPNLWILDTGATDHFSFNFSSFVEYKNIVPIPVSLPDGSQVVASVSGTVAISPSLTLHNVLYIPSFHVNLISIAKLVDSNNCFVQFNANICHILQNHSKEMIGIANLNRGLYILDSTTHKSSNSFVAYNPCNIWHSRLAHRTKFDSRARKAIFLGYREGTKGYILYDINNHTFFISRNMVFYEDTFPFKIKSVPSDTVLSELVPPTISHIQNLDDPHPVMHIDQPSTTDISFSSDVSTSVNDSASSPFNMNYLSLGPTYPNSPDLHLSTSPHPTDIDLSTDEPSTISEHMTDHNTLLPDESSIQPHPSADNGILPQSSAENNTLPLRQSSRTSQPPNYLKDYHCYYSTSHNSPQVKYPLSSVLTYDQCSSSYKHFCLSISYNFEPRTFTQAIKHDCWKQAMDVELQALAENQTWNVVELPSGKVFATLAMPRAKA